MIATVTSVVLIAVASRQVELRPARPSCRSVPIAGAGNCRTDKLAARIAGRIRVELGVVDRPVVGKTSRREPVGVTSAERSRRAALGRALRTAAPKGK